MLLQAAKKKGLFYVLYEHEDTYTLRKTNFFCLTIYCTTFKTKGIESRTYLYFVSENVLENLLFEVTGKKQKKDGLSTLSSKLKCYPENKQPHKSRYR